jgi:two-component system NtrC family sensor kinase
MNSLALDILLRKNGLSVSEPPTEEVWKNLLCELDEQLSSLEKSAQEGSSNEVDFIHESKLSTLGKFSAFIAHELNNPLTAVLSNASLLAKREYSQEKTIKKLNLILRQAERMKNIISHFSRLSNKSNSEPSNQNILSINEPISFASEFFESRFKDMGVEFVFSNDLPDGMVILGNSTNLESIFHNLFDNSLHSFEEKKVVVDRKIEIKVAHEEKSDVVSIIYQDNAQGMTEEVRSGLFKPFFTTKESNKGTGLGMPLVAQIVKDHLGKIGCRSFYGKGTLFKILIPRYNEKSDHSRIFDVSELNLD